MDSYQPTYELCSVIPITTLQTTPLLAKSSIIQGSLHDRLLTASCFQDLLPFLTYFKFSQIQTSISSFLMASPANLDNPLYQHLLLLQIESLLAQDQFLSAQEALQDLGKSIDRLKIGNHATRFLLCSAVCSRGLNQPGDALKSLDVLLKFHTTLGLANSINAARTLYEIGLTYESIGRIKDAIESLKKALKIYMMHAIEETKLVLAKGLVEREIGRLCLMVGKLQEASEFLQRSLLKLESCLSRDNPEVGKTLQYIGQLYTELGKNKEALEYCDEALICLATSYEEGSLCVAGAYCALAGSLVKVGQLQLANEYYVKSLSLLEITSSSKQKSHAQFVEAYLGLAEAYWERGRNKEALAYYDKSLNQLKAWLGPMGESHLYAIRACKGLGKVYFEDLKLSEASKLFEKAIKAIEKEDLGCCLKASLEMCIGEVYLYEGKVQKADKCFKKAMKLFKKELREDNYSIAYGYKLDGMTWKSLGRVYEAQQSFIHGLMLMKKAYGDEDHRLWEFYYCIGLTYISQGKLRDAAETLEKAIILQKKFADETKKGMDKVYFSLGDVYAEQMKTELALKNYRSGLLVHKYDFQEEKSSLSDMHECIGKIYMCQGMEVKALGNFQAALEVKAKHKGYEDPQIADIYLNIAKVHYHEERYQEAVENLSAGLLVLQKHFGSQHISMHPIYHYLGKVFFKKQMFKEAFDSYDKTIILLKRTFGEKTALLGEVYRDLGNICQIQGQLDSAQVYLQMAVNLQKMAWNKEYLKVAKSSLDLGCLYGYLENFNLAIKYLEESKRELEEAGSSEERKEQVIQEKIIAYKKSRLLCESLDC